MACRRSSRIALHGSARKPPIAFRPPAAEDLSGGYGPRRFYRYTASDAGQALALSVAEGLTTTANDGIIGAGAQEPELGNNEVQARRNVLASVVSQYATAGFDVVAAEDAFLGPGQRGGVFRKLTQTTGENIKSQQRGGAIVATRYLGSEPVEIAHLVVGHDETSKGGGGGAQSNHQSRYDPAVAADVLKARFVDRSRAIGVDLMNGGVTYVAPAQVSIGNGGFPYELSAQLIWRGGNYASEEFGPLVHTQPQTPWTTNWQNNLTVSASALEAMGSTDARAAAGTIAAFLAQQDIYRAAVSTQREVAGVLAGSWWVDQISGNAVTVAVGAETRQFVRNVAGQWFLPGAAPHATLAQSGVRTPFMQTCSGSGWTHARGWNYGGVSFVVTNTHGDTQSFAHWQNSYYVATSSSCGRLRGFRLTTWSFPQGVSINFVYAPPPGAGQLDRLTEVSNSLGRRIRFSYSTDGRVNGFDNGLTGADLRSVTIGHNGPSFSLSDITDPSGAQTRFTTSIAGLQHRLDEVYDANDTTIPSLRYTYDTLNRAKEARDAVALQGIRPHYQFLIADGVRGERIDPAGGRYTAFYDTRKRLIGIQDELGRQTSVIPDGRGRVKEYVYPELDREVFEYDARNNVTKLTKMPKGCTDPESCNPAAIKIEASWHPTWNRPDWIRDAMHTTPEPRQTDFVYYPSGNGKSLLQTATRPSPDGVKPRPVYSFTYDGRGQVLDATDPTGLITRNAYNATNGNLETTIVNPGGVNSTTLFTYDAIGNLVTTTDPRTYVAENAYDNNRRKTLTKHHDGAVTANVIAAEQTTYDALGQVLKEEACTAFSGTSCTAWQMTKELTYTPTGKVQSEKNGAGNETLYTYDALDRTLIVKDPEGRRVATKYDLAGQVECTWRGWSTTSGPTTCAWDPVNPVPYNGTGPVRYAAYTYTDNGQQKTITDANNNRSTFEYDDLDRLSKLSFPVPAKGSNSSSTGDFEAYTYYPSGNPMALRKRADQLGSQTIQYSYDRLDRPTLKDIPGSTAVDVYYDHDAAGRPLYARFGSTAGSGIDYGYDSAKRLSSETSYGRTLAFQYDASGNRNRLTFPDSNFITYEYDALNRMTNVRESGTTVLVTNVWDARSRRTSVSRNNGASSTFGYDLASRLTSLAQDPSGTDQDLLRTLGYNLASQITSRTNASTAYNWLAPNLTKSYIADGLNRYTSISGTAYGYDGNQNLISDGSRNFTYDIENRLLTVAGGAGLTLDYDPLGRLRQSTSAGTSTQFQYDGDRLVAEYNGSGSVLRRYVHGAGVDEPLVWYEGSDLSTRRWLHADERGSIIATTASDGTATVSTYGTYGEPGTWTGVRFRYTGQIALPEAQLYHYKARVYDPILGRFLQTDPVGYKDDLNLYAYVGNDPMNRSDPTGLWSPAAHDAILLYAFEGRLPQSKIETLQLASRDFDKRTQATDQSHLHAMRQEGEAINTAQTKTADFISATLSEARALAAAGKTDAALAKLGEAMHPVMDSASPAHTDAAGNTREWKGMLDPSVLEHSPNDMIGSERTRDITPAIYKSQKELLNGMYNKVFGSGDQANHGSKQKVSCTGSRILRDAC